MTYTNKHTHTQTIFSLELSALTQIRILIITAAIAFLMFSLTGCATKVVKPTPNNASNPINPITTELKQTVVNPAPMPVSTPMLMLPVIKSPQELNTLPNWDKDNVLEAWPGLLKSCQKLTITTPWKLFCTAVKSTPNTEIQAKALLQKYLIAHLKNEPNVSPNRSIATSYFEPVYNASLQPIGDYQWPLYAAPSTATKLSRAQLTPEDGTVNAILQGKELAYLDNPIDAFLAQVQGSVQLKLLDGSMRRLGFAAKNEQPYQSIANALIAKGEFTANQASMERIKTWASNKTMAQVQAVLNTNPSFIFFKWLNLPAQQGAIGALGVSLTPMRSVAVDTAYIPLGVPIWLETQTIQGALSQLMLAQDTGSAIKGAARVDIYAGTGEAAGKFASAQKNASKVWVLMPKP